jgi:alpha-beta hydrolase superfamily lysophospholipase
VPSLDGDRLPHLGPQFVLYCPARHELLNETNRDEVQRDVLAWLAKTV